MSHIHRHSHPRGVPGEVTFDAWLVVAGIAVAIYLANSGVVPYLANLTADFKVLSSFLIGLFFTSVLTTTPAIVAIAEFSNFISPLTLAFVGAAGAVCGDLLIFRFIRSPLAHYFVKLASHTKLRAVGQFLDRGPLWWIVPAFGAILIATPLPDELGLIMMGLSHIRIPQFIVIAYTMNVIGIFIIAMTAQTLG